VPPRRCPRWRRWIKRCRKFWRRDTRGGTKGNVHGGQGFAQIPRVPRPECPFRFWMYFLAAKEVFLRKSRFAQCLYPVKGCRQRAEKTRAPRARAPPPARARLAARILCAPRSGRPSRLNTVSLYRAFFLLPLLCSAELSRSCPSRARARGCASRVRFFCGPSRGARRICICAEFTAPLEPLIRRRASREHLRP